METDNDMNDTKQISGCDIMQKLWNVAINCGIDDTGIKGSPNRIVSPIECDNVRNFLIMAGLKCCEERNINNSNVCKFNTSFRTIFIK